MRKIIRIELTIKTSRYLGRKQNEVNLGRDPRTTWNTSYRTLAINKVTAALRQMAGKRERCMYCEDSHGTQVDHFWPMVPYGNKTFLWENLIWVCSGCNQKKGNRFDLDEQGNPLLIDPTSEEPWDVLFYDPETGFITARYDLETGLENPKGAHTTKADVLPLNIDVVTDGRKRTQRNLRKAVHRFLDRIVQHNNLEKAQSELIEEIQDHDDYGLVQWYFLKDGRDNPPFRELRANYPEVWERVLESIR
ncbi:MAG: HNH endonuclease [Pirellulales bacterium]|nr:HNH endonuclease [Pirellulales bacterium]